MKTSRKWLVAMAIAASAALLCPTREAVAQQMFAMGRDGGGGTSTLLRVTPSPFSVTTVGSTTLGRLAGIDFQPGTNTLFAASAGNGTNPGSLFRLNPSTGAATLVGPTGFGSIVDLAIDNSGTIFGSDFGSLIRINPTTGAGTAVGPIRGDIEGLAVDPTSDTLFGLVWNTGDLYFVDKLTGATELAGTFGAPPVQNGQWNGFGINSSGFFYGSVGAGNGHIFLLNTDNFTVSLVGDAFDGSTSDIAFQRQVVPEPASIVLLMQIGIGAVGFGVYRARRRK